MRVIHLTRTTVAETVGGLEYHIAYLTEALRNRGHEVDIVHTKQRRGAVEQDRAERSRPPLKLRLGSRIPACMDLGRKVVDRVLHNWDAWGVARQVHKLRPDIVHQHNYLNGILTSWLLSRNYPVVFTNHTGAYLYLDRWPATRGVQRKLMNLFTAVIAPSRELLPATANSHYIPNGVDTSVFYPVSEPERKRLREKWKCEGKFVFICPRRWAPTKGIINLAKTLAFLSPEVRKKSLFLFAGNETPGYEQYQRSVADTLRGVDEVRVLGNVGHSELAELMNASDVCVIPSLMEATSLACLEAMACGTVVLGTATGGLTELIRDGENGWLVPPGDVGALHAAIQRIASTSAAEIEPMRKEALALRDLYTWGMVAARTESVYSLALQQCGKKRAVPGAAPRSAKELAANINPF